MSALSLNEFQTAALKSAMYPLIGGRSIYPFLGLAGEAGEVASHVLGGLIDTPSSDAGRDVVVNTLQLLAASGQICEIVKKGTRDTSGYLDFDKTRAVNDQIHIVSDVISRIQMQTKQVTPETALVVRAKASPMADVDDLTSELGDVLWYVAAAAHEHGLSLQVLADRVLEKLADRMARGVIHGSGDNR